MATGIGTSSSWTSPAAEWKSKLERLQQNGHHIGVTSSPFFPKDLNEYLRHTTEYLDERSKEIAKQGKRRIASNTTVDKTEIDVNHSADEFRKKEEGYMVVRNAKQDAEDKKARKSFLTVGERTVIWNPLYSAVPENADDQAAFGIPTRASWPDQNELKAEGEHRLSTYGERRFPLPRRDVLSGEAVRADVAAGRTMDELVRLNGEKIPWCKREVIAWDGLDRLESTERELYSANKTYNITGPFSPARSRISSGRNTPTNRLTYSGNSSRRSPAPGSRRVSDHNGRVDLQGVAGAGSVPRFNTFGRSLHGADQSQHPGSDLENNGGHVEVPLPGRSFSTPTNFGTNLMTNGEFGYLQIPGHAGENRSPSAQGYAHFASRAVSGGRGRTNHHKRNNKEKLCQEAQSSKVVEDYFGIGTEFGEEGGYLECEAYDSSEYTDQGVIEKVFAYVFEEED
jgi:hypothetical protein